MVKCNFCGDNIPPGTGKIYVKKDGRILNFCSMRCEKNMLKLGRKPLKTRWTQAFHKEKEKTKGASK